MSKISSGVDPNKFYLKVYHVKKRKKEKRLLSYLLKSLKLFLKLFLGNAMVVRFFKQFGMGLANLLLARFDTQKKKVGIFVEVYDPFDLSFRIERVVICPF